jgi:hypothetical protein
MSHKRSGRPVTKVGPPRTEEEIQRLADEEKTGYDLSRPVGSAGPRLTEVGRTRRTGGSGRRTSLGKSAGARHQRR